MKTLVIDCATQALSLALLDGDAVQARHHQLLGRGHAEALVPLIRDMLAGERADAVAVDVGPGSFTGIRVGIAAARALGLAWSVPVSGYGCLPLCAAMAQDDAADGASAIAVAMIGGHGESFWQRFDRWTLEPLGTLASTPASELAGLLEDQHVYGSAAAALVAERGWGDAVDLLPNASAYALLPEAHRHLPPSAIYGREADAKPMMPAATAS